MNKRSLLNLAMCSLLLSSLPVGLVGCKDYDGDIKDLNTTTGDLSSQLGSLKTALEAAQTAATNAANDAKAAADKADTATAEAALAKKAAEEAKAEAIAAAIAEVEKLQSEMSDMNAETAQKLAALSGQISGIQEDLDKIDMGKVEESIGALGETIKEANKQVEAIKVQLSALENLQASLSALQGDVADIKAKVAAIETIKTDLQAVKGKADANAAAIQANTAAIGEAKAEITAIKGELATLSAKISTEVSNAVNALAGLLKQRLTSVTLIPELYVGGIPTISFENGTYNKLEWKADKDLPSGGKYVYSENNKGQLIEDTITNGAVEAKYRLNPATIAANDIDLDGLGYFTQIATTRAGEGAKEVLKITGSSVGADGVLTVQLTNPNPLKLEEDLDWGQAYTVSLKVPIAKEHLLEGEANAEVYSEFTRLREVTFRPSLGLSYQAPNRGWNYTYGLFNGISDYSYLYETNSKSYVVKNLVYDKTYDLNDLFIGRMNNVTDTIANDNLAKYGLAVRYKVAGGSYTPGDSNNEVDQQKYVKLSGKDNSILTPQTPSGVTANQAIIGKAPILIAEMYDISNNNIVDAQYFKVMFTAQDTEDLKFTFNVSDYKGDACEMYYNFTWEYMTRNLLEKLNGGKGMSQTEFKTLYQPWMNSTQIPDSDIRTAYLDSYYDYSNSGWLTSPDVPAMKIYANENNLPTLETGDNELEFGNVITFESKVDGYPNIVITINWTPTLKVTKASFGETLASVWTNNTMEIRVMPMKDKDGNIINKTAKYATNILDGRKNPYVKDLLGCATYSIDIADTKLQDAALMKSLNNYTGALTIGNGFANGTMSKENQKDLQEVIFSLDGSNANAKTLASNGGTIRVDWTSNINGLSDNNYLVGSTYLKVLPILQYANQTVATITPALNPVTKSMSIEFKDAWGSKVTADSELWKFYGIESVTFKQEGIKIQTDGQTQDIKDTPFGVTVNGNDITFSSNGISVKASTLYVPFEVKHAWGVLKGNALVKLNKSPN